MASPTTTALKVYKLGVCLFPDLTQIDIHGPLEILGGFSTEVRKKYGHLPLMADSFPSGITIDPVHIGVTLDLVRPMSGPSIKPDVTYAEVEKQFDILLIGGGPGGVPGVIDPIINMLSKATTNKLMYKMITEATKGAGHKVEWVPKARFVASDDKKIWTSSGITAGLDVAAAFLAFITSPEFAKRLLTILEYTPREEGADEFAVMYGLA